MLLDKRIAMFVLFVTIAVGTISCGGGSSTASPTGTTVTTIFSATPAAVAVQIGNGAWNAVSLQGNQLTFTVPTGESRYAIAYVCALDATFNFETVWEATTRDPTPSGGCAGLGGNSALNEGWATGAVDASSIAGASYVWIFGGFGIGFVPGATGSFNVPMLQGTNDIAFVAGSLARSVLAVKILRSQTIPGAVNNGHTVVFAPGDETSYQAFSVTDIPKGFTVGSTVSYVTSNGTSFYVSVLPGSQYAVVPLSEAQANDRYLFSASDIRYLNPPAGGSQSAYITMTAASATAVTLPLPPPLPYSPPTPAEFPSFNVAYTGFAVSSYGARLSWSSSGGSSSQLTVTATPDYQAGESTIKVPDLTTLAGFLLLPPSGTDVAWTVNLPKDKSQPSDPSGFVTNKGAYIEP
jgi:hypothetical protein